MGKKKAIWLTWERQRRSVELAKALGINIFILTDRDRLPRLFRYLFLSVRTLLVLIRERPQIVFAQNPSMILAFFLCLTKILFKYKLVVDRHSNFKFHTFSNRTLKWRGFHFLSRFTIRHSDLTIVTNEYLCNVVQNWGGNGFVLQDKLPLLELGERITLGGGKNIVYICSYSDDEPVEQVVAAAKNIDPDWMVYITGKIRHHRIDPDSVALPANVCLTGFVSEKEYQDLLVSADLLLVLTKQDHTLTCGAYEAVSLAKPLVISNTITLMNYFSSGAIYTDINLNSQSIADSIKEGIYKTDQLMEEIIALKISIDKKWPQKLEALIDLVWCDFAMK